MTTPEEHLAQRVEDDAFFLASLLSLYAQCEDLNDAMLAEHLGGAVRDLPLLRLCRAPVLEPASDFQRDIHMISERFRLDPQKLAEVVRRGQVLMQLQNKTSTSGSMLLAARDRNHDSQDTLSGDSQ